MPGTPILSLQVASSSPAQLEHPASPPPPPESPPPVDDDVVGPDPAVDAPAPPAPPSLCPAQPDRTPSMATARATCFFWLVSTATSTSRRWGRMASGRDQTEAHDPSVCRFEQELPAWRRRFPRLAEIVSPGGGHLGSRRWQLDVRVVQRPTQARSGRARSCRAKGRPSGGPSPWQGRIERTWRARPSVHRRAEDRVGGERCHGGCSQGAAPVLEPFPGRHNWPAAALTPGVALAASIAAAASVPCGHASRACPEARAISAWG